MTRRIAVRVAWCVLFVALVGWHVVVYEGKWAW